MEMLCMESWEKKTRYSLPIKPHTHSEHIHNLGCPPAASLGNLWAAARNAGVFALVPTCDAAGSGCQRLPDSSIKDTKELIGKTRMHTHLKVWKPNVLERKRCLLMSNSVGQPSSVQYADFMIHVIKCQKMPRFYHKPMYYVHTSLHVLNHKVGNNFVFFNLWILPVKNWNGHPVIQTNGQINQRSIKAETELKTYSGNKCISNNPITSYLMYKNHFWQLSQYHRDTMYNINPFIDTRSLLLEPLLSYGHLAGSQ